MDQYLRKYQWALNFALIAVGATLVALILNRTVVSGQLVPYTVPKLPTYQLNKSDQQTSDDSGPNPGQWNDALSSRCLFGCPSKQQKKTCPADCADDEKCKDGVCIPKQPKEKDEPESDKPRRPDVPVESDLNVKLEGCMVADNPKYSTALVRDGKSEKTYVVGPGDFLPENVKVVSVARDRVFIRRDNGKLEFIRLEETIQGNPSPVSVGPASGNPRSGTGPSPGGGGEYAGANPPSPEGSSGGGGVVESKASDEVVLSKKQVRKKLENPRELAQEVRAKPTYGKEGEEKGIQLSSMPDDSLYSRMGFETGDILKSIGGEPVRSQTDIQRLIDKLENQETVEVTVERGGRDVEKQFKLD